VVHVTARCLCAIPALLLSFPSSGLAEDVVDLAASLIGRPYVWGAEGPRSFDCSGLTQFVFQEFGIELPRRAVSQSRVGDRVGRSLRRGDLLFFSDDAGQTLVTHVGIYEGRGRMIEASRRAGKVRRSDLNDPFWTGRFMFGRRVTSLVTGRTEDEPDPPARPRTDRRRVAVRVIQEIAETLLRRPR
jgi:cell wall-associated NlpC family hydrolase